MEDVISVIIPIHNAEKYLDRILEEVTFQTDANLDVVLIDDGSTDQSLQICKNWEQRDTRIRAFSQEASGVSAARNRGLQLSKGSYITFLDADDEIEPDYVECLYNAFAVFRKQHQMEADFTVCGYRTVSLDSKEKPDTKEPDQEKDFLKYKTGAVHLPGKETYADRGIMEALFTDEGFFSAVWNKMFRRETLLTEAGDWILFTEDIHIAEDTLWLTKVLKNARYGAVVQRPLYTWIRRTESATGGQKGVEISLDPEKMSVIRAYKLMTEELKSYDSNLSHYTQKVYMGLLRDFLVEAYRQKNGKIVKKLMKQAIREQADFPRKNVQDGLFLTKYRICLDLIRRRAPVRLLEKVSEA